MASFYEEWYDLSDGGVIRYLERFKENRGGRDMIKEAQLWEKLDQQKVHCYLCAHECRIPEAKLGVCGVRRNDRER